jgi:mRNA interferase YafQ
MLINEQPLLAKHHNHPLHGGEWEGKWECHVEPDWLLVYRIDKKKGLIMFYRTGTHTDLF